MKFQLLHEQNGDVKTDYPSAVAAAAAENAATTAAAAAADYASVTITKTEAIWEILYTRLLD